MFQTLRSLTPNDPALPDRVWRLTVLDRVLNGTIYDPLLHEFHEERTTLGDYIPLSQRKPSVRANLCRTVVEDSVALLFGEGRFPAVETPDRATRAALAQIMAETNLPAVMTEAATRGSVGSVAVVLRVLEHKPHFTAMDSRYLTPEWDPLDPDRLLRVTERFKVEPKVLNEMGYSVDPRDGTHWFMREWDDQNESWFLPWPASRTNPRPRKDKGRSVQHGLGFVPVAWIRNLPGGDDIDGACTFRPAIETAIEIDYMLSQAGRGLKYASDPTLVIKDGPDAGTKTGGAANALLLPPTGDAELLEINGTASGAVMDYVRALRETALESIHGNRANADRISAAQSGRAMELLHQPLIWLADRLRHSYGAGLLDLLRMLVMASQKMELRYRDGTTVPRLTDPHKLTLRWPAWFQQTENDRQTEASTLKTLVEAGLLSRETAARLAAQVREVDPDAELVRLTAPAAAT